LDCAVARQGRRVDGMASPKNQKTSEPEGLGSGSHKNGAAGLVAGETGGPSRAKRARRN